MSDAAALLSDGGLTSRRDLEVAALHPRSSVTNFWSLPSETKLHTDIASISVRNLPPTFDSFNTARVHQVLLKRGACVLG